MEKTMKDSCDRAGDMVAYLYGEANESEVLDFQSHMNNCSTCLSELSAFGNVRVGLAAWRDQALHPIAELAAAPATERSRVQREKTRRTALNALREFFTLSPLWLKGATAFATLVFIALMIFAASRFFVSSDVPVVSQVPLSTRGAQDNVQAIATAGNEKANSPFKAISTGDVVAHKKASPRSESRSSVRVSSKRGMKATDLSNEELSQLSDLLIAAKEDEENVPRLYDLVSESNEY